MLLPVDHVTLISRESISHLSCDLEVLDVSTSEYPYEFAATIVSVLKGLIAEPYVNNGASVVDFKSSILRRVGIGSMLVRIISTIASLPAYCISYLARDAACLKVVMAKPL